MKKQQIGQNTVLCDLQRGKTQNKAKDIELQALKQTLVSDEFNNTDKALMEQYKKAELQKMELEHMRNILKLKTENNVERAKIEAMNQANESIRSDLPKLQKQNIELQTGQESKAG